MVERLMAGCPGLIWNGGIDRCFCKDIIKLGGVI